MNMRKEITEWNNPLRDFSEDYWQNGLFTENGGLYNAVFTSEQVIAVSALMMLGMNKVTNITSGEVVSSETAEKL